MRFGASFILFFVFFLGSHPLQASKPSARELFLEKNYQGALDLYLERIKKASRRAKSRLEFGAGTAALKAGKHSLAREHLGKSILTKDPSLKAKAYYNLGNTLYAQGEAALKKAAGGKPADSTDTLEKVEALWKGAIRQFENAETLAESPLREDAVYNRKLVQKKLDFLKNQQQQNQDQQNDENQDQNQDEKQDSEDDGSKSEKGDQGSSEEEKKDGQDQEEQQNQDPGKEKEEEEKKDGDDENKDSQSKDDQKGDKGDQKNLDQPKQNFEGDIESENQNPESGSSAQQAPDAFEATEDGKLSEAGARALLESLENEEVQLQIKPRKRNGGNIRDW